jgi:hypothetical protein
MDERFERLAARFLEESGVSVGTGFGGSGGLRIGKKIFAIFRENELVLKLPRQRVDELVASGAGTRFDPRRDGRDMKEWIVVPGRRAREWDQLADEALEFVRTTAK